jgi:hypothetical protein
MFIKYTFTINEKQVDMSCTDEEKLSAAPVLLPPIKHRPLVLEDFRHLPALTKIRLFYKRFNTGSFIWEHHGIDGDRLVGRFHYEESGWSKPGRYLYQYEHVVCVNSGREPVWNVHHSRWGAGEWSDDDTSEDDEEQEE